MHIFIVSAHQVKATGCSCYSAKEKDALKKNHSWRERSSICAA